MKSRLVDETEDWLPIGGLEPGFDENKPIRTEELAGKELAFIFQADRAIIGYVFGDTSTLAWEVLEGPEKGIGDGEAHETIRVAPDIDDVERMVDGGSAVVDVGTMAFRTQTRKEMPHDR